MTEKHLVTWPESPKRVREKMLTHAKHTPTEAIRNNSRARVETSLRSELDGACYQLYTYLSGYYTLAIIDIATCIIILYVCHFFTSM